MQQNSLKGRHTKMHLQESPLQMSRADFQIKDIERWPVDMCLLILQVSRIISLRFVSHTSFLKATSALSSGLHPGMRCHNRCHNRSLWCAVSCCVSAGLHFPSPHGPSPLRKMVVEEVPRMEAMAERIQPVQKPALGTIMTDSVQHERKILEKQHMNSCYTWFLTSKKMSCVIMSHHRHL